MEKAYTILADLRRQAHEGVKRESLRDAVMALDAEVLRALKPLGYDAWLAKGTRNTTAAAKIRKADIEGKHKDAYNNPVAMLPDGLAAIAESIDTQVRHDLLAQARDFRFGDNLSFCISFAASRLGIPALAVRNTDEIETFKEQGYTVEKSKVTQRYSVVDCDQNRRMLTDYCKKQFGAYGVRIMAFNGDIEGIDITSELDDCPYIDPMGIEKPVSETISAEEQKGIEWAVKKCREHIRAFRKDPAKETSETWIFNFAFYVQEIERLIGVHGRIWEDGNAGFLRIRQAELDAEAEYKMRAYQVLQEQGYDLLNKARQGLAALLCPLGLDVPDAVISVDESFLKEPRVEFQLCTSQEIDNLDKLSLKTKAKPCCEEYYPILNVPGNIKVLNDALEAALPGMRLKTESLVQDGVQVLVGATVTSYRPQGLKNLIKPKT